MSTLNHPRIAGILRNDAAVDSISPPHSSPASTSPKAAAQVQRLNVTQVSIGPCLLSYVPIDS